MPGSRFGISPGGVFEWSSDADLTRQLDGFEEIGAGWVRADFKWSVIEGTRGSFNWSLYDRLASTAKARGLKVVAVLAYSPGWARTAPGTDDKFPPANVADYAAFARKAVERYAPQGITHFELWNEPNLAAFWKPKPDPVKYAQLVSAAYTAMKAANPSITVLAGAFSPAGGYHDTDCNNVPDSGTATTLNQLDFLEIMYRNGAKGRFDAVSTHPYAGSGGPTWFHRCNAWSELAATSPSLRSLMEANGDGGKKIWATEFGTDLSWVGGDEQKQAKHLTDAFRLWLSYPWAGGLMYYAYKQNLEGHNLVRADWSPRPVWHAFKAAPKQ
jgi:polysaccharide biosynthesis protein PslG